MKLDSYIKMKKVNVERCCWAEIQRIKKKRRKEHKEALDNYLNKQRYWIFAFFRYVMGWPIQFGGLKQEYKRTEKYQKIELMESYRMIPLLKMLLVCKHTNSDEILVSVEDVVNLNLTEDFARK